MKIYVSAPNEHREKLEDFYKAIAKLANSGHKMIDVYKDGKSESAGDVDALVKKYKESERGIRESDIYLVDVSFPGRRVGFEIARALDERKFIIALYKEDSDKSAKRIAPLIVENNKHVFFKGYTSDTIESIVNQGLNLAKDKMDTKFILIISPEINRYLEWSADQRRMHKAQIVRNAVEDTMAKDKEYQQFLKDLDAA